jgi:hypothetical protein
MGTKTVTALHSKKALLPFSQRTERAPYLSMKEGSLFCFVLMRSTEPGRLRSCSWGSLEKSFGAWAWFHGVWTCSAKVVEY